MKKFKRIEPTDIHNVGGEFKRTIVVKRFETEDGLKHEFGTYDNENSQGVAVLAITTDYKVVVAHQFRPGQERHCFDLPGGVVEAGEDMEEAARRELLEETGYQSPEPLEYLGQNSGDGYGNFTNHYFMARNCQKVAESQLDKAELDQGLEVQVISIGQLIKNAKSDCMTGVPAILMAYDRLQGLNYLSRKLLKNRIN